MFHGEAISGEAISAAVGTIWVVLVSSAWKSAVFLLFTMAAARLLNRRSAAARHLVWTVALAALLVIPVLEALLPPWSVPVASVATFSSLTTVALPAAPECGVVEAAAPASDAVTILEGTGQDQTALEPVTDSSRANGGHVAASVVAQEVVVPEVVARASARAGLSSSWRTWLVATWLLGAVWMLARLTAGIALLHRLQRRSSRIVEGRLIQQLQVSAQELGVDRAIILLMDSEKTIPMTWGWLKSTLLLPREAESWSAERLRIVLLHELAHIARGDYVWQTVGAIARAVYWFNPLVWLGFGKLKAELEQACDDRVLVAGADAMAYASELLQITSQFGRPRSGPSAALAIGRTGRIRRRLESILDESRNRRRLSHRSACGLTLAGLALSAVVGSCQGLQVRAAETPAGSGDARGVAGTAVADDAASDRKPEEQKNAPGPGAAPPTETGSRLSDVRTRILKNSVKALDERALDEAAIRGMLQSLNDPHSEYLPKQKLKELTQSLAGELMGIGAQLKVEEKQLVVITPLPGSPAQAAGLKPRDAIVAVDGKPVAKLGANEAIAAIRGPAGTVVSLQVKRADGGEESLKVTRGTIRTPSIRGLNLDESGKWTFWLDREAKLGYVGIVEFGKPTAADCRAALKALMAEGLKGLVIDLRHCPGGMLDAVADTAKLLLHEGKIVTVKGGQHPETVLSASGSDVVADLPLLVLIDDRTASAAEILAGALKDNGRATLLGTRTFGKGSVQSILPVDDDGAIRLTTAYFYLPSGRNIDRQPGPDDWGVDPSDGFYVPVTAEQQEQWRLARLRHTILDSGARRVPAKDSAAIAAAIENELADPQLAAAYKALSARISSGAFTKVGKSEADLKAHYARRENLLRQKADALKQLETIEQELTTEPGAKK